MNPTEFLNILVVNILKVGLSEKKIENHGGVKNTIWQCAYRNTKIGYKVMNILTSMIESEIRFDKSKRKEVFNFLKQFLTVGEKEYMKKNINDIKSLVRFASMKINNKNEGFMISKNEKGGKFKIVDIPELLKMGWTIRDYVKRATSLSYEVYDEELTEDHVTELEKSIKVVSEQPDNRRMLLDENNELIGMWSFKPFYSEIFKKAKKGELFDSEITPSIMPTLIPGGIYNIYFTNIVLKKRYRNTTAYIILLYSIIELIKKWAEEDIFINEICAQAYSDNGKNLCKTVGLDFIKKHIDHGDIYCGYVSDLVNKPFCNRFDDIEELRDLYKEFKKKEKNYQLV